MCVPKSKGTAGNRAGRTQNMICFVVDQGQIGYDLWQRSLLMNNGDGFRRSHNQWSSHRHRCGVDAEEIKGENEVNSPLKTNDNHSLPHLDINLKPCTLSWSVSSFSTTAPALTHSAVFPKYWGVFAAAEAGARLICFNSFVNPIYVDH